MNRRQIMMTMAAATLATPAAAGPAGAERGESLIPGDRHPVRLALEGGGFVTVEALVVSDGRRTLAVRFRGGADLYNEARFDLSRLGGLFRPVFNNRLAQARPFGPAVLAGRTLVVRGEDLTGLAGQSVTLGAAAHSWDLPTALVPVSAGAFDLDGRAIGGARIAADGRLLVQIAARAAL